MAVRPSQRTEMSAVYSTYRDVSSVITPGTVSLVLMLAPLKAVFGITAACFLGCVLVARKLHPRLGVEREKTIKVDQIADESGVG